MTTRFFASAALALALAGCGGGDSSSTPPPTGGGPTPSPSPTPSPTPSPSPTPTYQTFSQLTGNRTFATACGGNYNGPQRNRVGGGQLSEEVFRIVSDRSQPSYQISTSGNGQSPFFSTTFTQLDRDTTATGEAYRKTTANGFTERFSIFPLTFGGAELPYVRVTSIVAESVPGFTVMNCAIGVPTVATDRPPATVTYTGLASFGTADITRTTSSGLVTENYRINSSILSLSANPATGEVRFSVDLKGQLVSGGIVSPTVTDLGVFTGTVTLDGSAPVFNGPLANSSNVVWGAFGGGFFGPQGITPAVSVRITEVRADQSELGLGALFILRPQS